MALSAGPLEHGAKGLDKCNVSLYSRLVVGARDKPRSVGEYIRQRIFTPRDMTVAEAAKRLSVSRVALSNLLNGNATLSWQMALRLKTAFGADPDELFRIQAESERDARREEEREMAVRPYVPPFLRMIKTAQIHAWADQNEEARNRLPVLVRRLIRSTGRELQRVDFPAYGEVQRGGWDGLVEAKAATPWIPRGKSGWEVSTAKNPRRKADEDFKSRLAKPAALRAEVTFVFVSSRRWPDKRNWEKDRKADGHWKDVRALDASDLEQWIEASPEGQVWLAEQLGRKLDDCMSLDRAWDRWAVASDPPMTATMFGSAVAAHRGTFVSWLQAPNPERPFVVAADSKDEALAYLACLSQEAKLSERGADERRVLAEFRDRAVAIESAPILRTLAPSTSSFVPIVFDEETERELVHRRHHSIVVRPRNAVGREPDIALSPLGDETFRKSLTAMGFEREDIHRLARESGRSPTILRRRLSKNDAIRRPRWAKDNEIARKLLPMALVGAWDDESPADREMLVSLSERPFHEFERDVRTLLGEEDSPVWLVGKHRGVVSQIDALFAIGPHVTSTDLDLFFDRAARVVSEPDPALELAPEKKWAAAVYGKTRVHSDALRTGICETLVLLAVHGNGLLPGWLGSGVGKRVSELVSRLLAPAGIEAPLTAETIMSLDRDLPRLAEAAPDEFLRVLKADLNRRGSVFRGLLDSVETDLFTASPRAGLLWALECLAWSPPNLSRVVLILAQLAETRTDDNDAHKPIHSLEAIFQPSGAQTAAPLCRRIQTLKLLSQRAPDVAWQVCVDLLGARTGQESYRPKWRGDASGAGGLATPAESERSFLAALQLALDWPEGHDVARLGDLVQHLGVLSEANQNRIWSLVETWLAGRQSDADRAELRKRLRRFAFTATRGRGATAGGLRSRAREMYERLAPKDPAARNAWLFAEHWIRDWPEDFDGTMGFSEREERIGERRTEVMTEIWSSEGLKGALSLLPSSNAAETVGSFTSRCVLGRLDRAEVVRTCLASDLSTDPEIADDKMDRFLRGFVGEVGEESREELLSNLAEELPQDEMARLLLCAPCSRPTWRIVDRQGREVQKTYWKSAVPHPGTQVTADEITELVDNLLGAGRPRAAFNALYLAWDAIETSQLTRLLSGIVAGPEPDRSIRLVGTYEICRAIESLNARTGVSRDEMADLEFVFFNVLKHDEYGVPNLQRRLAEEPGYFTWLVALAYKRTDGREDPERWSPGLAYSPFFFSGDVAANKRAFSRLAFSVLDEVKPIPGGSKAGESEIHAGRLLNWVLEARRRCSEIDRVDISDYCIGRLLARKPAANEGSWPALPICEVLETVATDGVASGFRTGVANLRGAVWRGEGGDQERELASQYRAWAEPLDTEFPFVSQVLESIARRYDEEAAHWDSRLELDKRLQD